MDTKDFLAALEPYPTRALIFDLGEQRVRPGYHVTEVKAVNVQGMDCGGQGDAWSETVIQLWAPDNAKEPFMRVGKFLSIYSRVAERIPVAEDAGVRLEYGDIGAPAISYHVQNIQLKDKEVVVRLAPPAVTCKARERSYSDELENLTHDLPVLDTASNCCAPTTPNSIKQSVCCD